MGTSARSEWKKGGVVGTNLYSRIPGIAGLSIPFCHMKIMLDFHGLEMPGLQIQSLYCEM